MKFVSLFSGAGGLDLGLEQTGWDCLFATDHDPASIATLNANRGYGLDDGREAFAETVIELADVRSLSGDHILSRLGMSKGSIPLLAGGPPCQSWSSAGLQKGYDDPRGRLVDDYLRIASEIDARWLMFENVRGLLTARGPDGVPGSALARVRADLFQRGWQTRVELLNAADFGVPQRRVRLILIGYQSGDAPRIPEATHSNVPSEDRLPWVPLAQCLKSIREPDPDEIIRPTGKMALELSGLAPGTGAKSPGKAESTRPGGHWGYKQGAFIADPAVPNRTVTASAQQDWIRDPVLGLRRLSPRECAAIQTFPANWFFAGKRSDQYRLIGNAVPPALARKLGEALASHITQDSAHRAEQWDSLTPLPKRLQGHISYTIRDEKKNGASRRAGIKRPLLNTASL
ncbi:DNA cytosine methyltransferase [uncultured Sphingomonas sp.]|uniref:DNA cytosine methyltransferase n=1 Tax=uncultured Sphingomonas sp. TaxID=158754 RepID=UPI0025FB1BFE|nr:DNA cytosine methyltransferase [uncultured Sphingomonas sp.]